MVEGTATIKIQSTDLEELGKYIAQIKGVVERTDGKFVGPIPLPTKHMKDEMKLMYCVHCGCVKLSARPVEDENCPICKGGMKGVPDRRSITLIAGTGGNASDKQPGGSGGSITFQIDTTDIVKQLLKVIKKAVKENRVEAEARSG